MSNICYRGPRLNKVAELIHEFKLNVITGKARRGELEFHKSRAYEST